MGRAVRAVADMGGWVFVRFEEVQPPPGCTTLTWTLTSPILVVAVPRVEGNVQYLETQRYGKCP